MSPATQALPKRLAGRVGPRLVPTARSLVKRTGLPPLHYWPAAVPGAATALERAWGWTLRHTPAVPVEQQAADAGVGEIEEVIGCALCGGRRVQPLFRPARSGWSYRVVRCAACGFLFRSPGIRPERLGDLYANQYSRFLTGDYAAGRQRRYGVVMDAFAPLFSDGDGRRLLDYGCGAGLFLELAHRRGFDGYGVDLSPDSIEVARTRPGGAHTYVGSPRDVPELARGGFDAITMWSVLAHLPRPVEELTMLRELLNRDGVLLIFTVNANSLLLKATRSGWGGFTRNHLMFYAPATLQALLRRAGFGAVVSRPHYGDVVELGELKLPARTLPTLADGNRAHMQRAVAFRDPDGPARWGLEADAVRL
ncbi:MAG TPA: class I SAM-dependent methyltransferase [Solirubrobacter sp.]|nr:class I SAM-dependent methyltransferase [Solirubrobacter sp.]